MLKRLFNHSFVLAVSLLIVLFAFAGNILSVNADSDADYRTKDFDVKIKVNKDYSFEYTENITVDFTTPHHGIFRNIPLDAAYKIDKVEVKGYESDVYTDNGSRIIKIGSKDELLSGIQKFKIKYRIRGIADKDKARDFMYIDMLTTGWNTPIDHGKAVVSYPEDMKFRSLKCYYGPYGSKDELASKMFKKYDEKHIIVFEDKNIPQQFGATIKAELPEGYWKGALNYNWIFPLYIAIAIIAAAILAYLRFTIGRNPDIVETVEFYPPENLTPLDVGYVIDGNVDNEDIVSTFFYLASKGYIKIREYEKKEFEFERLAIPDGEKKSIMTFFRGIFGSKSDNEQEENPVVKSVDIGERLAGKFDSIRAHIDNEFSGERKVFTARSKKADIAAKVIFFLVLALFYMLSNVPTDAGEFSVMSMIILPSVCSGILTLVLSRLCTLYYYKNTRRGKNTTKFILSCIVYIIFGLAYSKLVCYIINDNRLYPVIFAFIIIYPLLLIGMKTRGAWSAKVYGRLLGFKRFIKEAELEKLNELVEQDPDYFYNILPYAYVFGMTKKWASNFEKISIDKPGWYEPYGMNDNYVYDALVMNTMFNSLSNDITSSMIDTSDKGGGIFDGGGFSGGGFSGGGFGGGGGGAW